MTRHDKDTVFFGSSVCSGKAPLKGYAQNLYTFQMVQHFINSLIWTGK